MGEQLPAEPEQKLVIPHHPDWICRRTVGRPGSFRQRRRTPSTSERASGSR